MEFLFGNVPLCIKDILTSVEVEFSFKCIAPLYLPSSPKNYFTESVRTSVFLLD